MRILYWLDYKFYSASVALGTWAFKRWYRPYIVWIGVAVIMASLVAGLLGLLENLIPGRK